MVSPMTSSVLTLSDLERSNSRSLRFRVVRELYGIDIFAHSNIANLIWMSQKGVCWLAGFSAVPAVLLIYSAILVVSIIWYQNPRKSVMKRKYVSYHAYCSI